MHSLSSERTARRAAAGSLSLRSARFCRRGEILSLFVACLPNISGAHSFATPYTLPIPFWMYGFGCSATLVLTFAAVGYFVGLPPSRPQEADENTTRSRLPSVRWTLVGLRTGAVACLLLTILSGLIGTTEPDENIGMTLFWVVFLLGFTYLTVFVGDLYPLINPWKLGVDTLERIGFDLSTCRLRQLQPTDYWLAFSGYLGLIWIELFVGLSPLLLSLTLLVYSLLTLVGVVLFGKKVWFTRADPFSVFFALVSKLAPLEYRSTHEQTSWFPHLRAPFAGVLNDRPDHMSLVLFVLLLLSSTTYDAIHDTIWWVGLFWRNLLLWLEPLWNGDLGKAQRLLMGWYLVYRQAGLILFPLLYLGLYLLVLWCTKLLTRTGIPVRVLALNFSYTLIPIAVAYHFTHYCAFLLTQMHRLPWLLADPFGFGWHLLGFHSHDPSFNLPMRVLWHTQVAILLLGHVVSVYLAHRVALNTFATPRETMLSQLPLLVLMVGYTIAGLWIMSLPLGSINS